MDVMIGWRLRQASAIPASGRRQTFRRQTSQSTRVAHFGGPTRAIIAGTGRKAAPFRFIRQACATDVAAGAFAVTVTIMLILPRLDMPSFPQIIDSALRSIN